MNYKNAKKPVTHIIANFRIFLVPVGQKVPVTCVTSVTRKTKLTAQSVFQQNNTPYQSLICHTRSAFGRYIPVTCVTTSLLFLRRSSCS